MMRAGHANPIKRTADPLRQRQMIGRPFLQRPIISVLDELVLNDRGQPPFGGLAFDLVEIALFLRWQGGIITSRQLHRNR